MPAPSKVCPLCSLRYDAGAIFCQRDGARLVSEAPSDPFVGREILGQFRIAEAIGSGGMGTVYRAHQASLDRDVAVKILHPDLTQSADAVRRFHREAKVATSLEHPNLVRVFLFGELPEDKSLYLVMEHLAGRPLVDALEQDGLFTLPRALHVAAQICDAVGAAHAKGIVHRDVKPENVMLVERFGDPDFVKVLDFGIARLLWDQQSALTQTGVIFGTARYISPEGAAGEPTDARSDVYSIGVLAYQLLTGVTPFDASTPVSMLMKHIHDSAPPLRQRGEGRRVPQVIADVVMRALAKNPDMRFDDAGVMGQALRRAADLAAISLPTGFGGARASWQPSAPAAAPRARREATPTDRVRSERRETTDVGRHGRRGESTAALVAGIPGLPSRPRWTTMFLAFVLGASAVVGAVFAIRHFTSDDTVVTERRELLARAREAFARGDLDAPADENVLALTARVLELEPEHRGAARLRREVGLALREQALAKREAEDLEGEREIWRRLLAFFPEDAAAASRVAELSEMLSAAPVEPGLQISPERRVLGEALTFEAVLAEGEAVGEDGRFEIWRAGRRVATVPAVRAGIEWQWLGTTTIRTAGAHEVRFVVTGAPSLAATIEIERATTVAARMTSVTPAAVTTLQPIMTTPTPPPPPAMVDDGIDWSLPSTMTTTMTDSPTAPVAPSLPPPHTGAPPPEPWTGG